MVAAVARSPRDRLPAVHAAARPELPPCGAGMTRGRVCDLPCDQAGDRTPRVSIIANVNDGATSRTSRAPFLEIYRELCRRRRRTGRRPGDQQESRSRHDAYSARGLAERVHTRHQANTGPPGVSRELMSRWADEEKTFDFLNTSSAYPMRHVVGGGWPPTSRQHVLQDLADEAEFSGGCSTTSTRRFGSMTVSPRGSAVFLARSAPRAAVVSRSCDRLALSCRVLELRARQVLPAPHRRRHRPADYESTATVGEHLACRVCRHDSSARTWQPASPRRVRLFPGPSTDKDGEHVVPRQSDAQP